MRPITSLRLAWFPVLCLLSGPWVLGAAGCGGSSPAVQSLYYSLQYQAPQPRPAAKLDTVLTVARFSTAPGFNATDMYYGNDQVELASYNYNRWLVIPGDMVGDFLARDLAASGSFTAVFSHRDGVNGRFKLQGSVRRFQELDQGDKARALLELSITLLDTSQASVPRRVMFQRRYRGSAPMAKKDAHSLATAMSRALARVSARVTGDIVRAVARRLAAPAGAKQPRP